MTSFTEQELEVKLSLG